MQWSKTKPTVPGWYWFVRKASAVPDIVYVPTAPHVKGMPDTVILPENDIALSQYAGPIPRPEECCDGIDVEPLLEDPPGQPT